MIRASICAAAALCACTTAAAQSVLPPLFGSITNPLATEFPPPKPFGTNIKQLPGQRIGEFTAIKGQWFHRAAYRNVVIENERIPQVYTGFQLDLQPDGSYTLEYSANWGGVRNSSDPRFSAIKVNEKGHFSLSGSILLLRPDVIDLTRDHTGTSTRETLANENRGYVARLDKDKVLNIAGPCARYQVEPVCREARSVWFSLKSPPRR